MRYIGIDPGLEGAVAVLDYDGLLLEQDDLPIFRVGTHKMIDMPEFLSMLHIYVSRAAAMEENVKVVVELQNPRPGGGVVSSFRSGICYGSLMAAVQMSKIPWTTVTPAKWKRAMGLTKEKQLSLDTARRLFPSASLSRKKDHNRAEALLIAEYARQKKL